MDRIHRAIAGRPTLAAWLAIAMTLVVAACNYGTGGGARY
jgi:hypothetical protein